MPADAVELEGVLGHRRRESGEHIQRPAAIADISAPMPLFSAPGHVRKRPKIASSISRTAAAQNQENTNGREGKSFFDNLSSLNSLKNEGRRKKIIGKKKKKKKV